MGCLDGTKTQWNSAGFNPVLSGITRNVILHTKNSVYQTLPLYSNLKTTGTYVYGSDWDIADKTATINVETEVRNEADQNTNLNVEVAVVDKDGKLQWSFETEDATAVPVATDKGVAFTDIVPEDAYVWEDKYNKLTETEQSTYDDNDTTLGNIPEPTDIRTVYVNKIKVSARVSGIRFWSPDDPYLYDVYTILKDEDGNILDVTQVSTGFRKTEVKGGTDNGGVYINDKYYYLKGYAQRATNEWGAIGTSTDWLDDYDMKLLRESNANFVRWMHIAAEPSDVRACDKYGIVIVQPAGDGEGDTKGRQWDQRVEVMRDAMIYFRNNPSIIFWECGNNKVSAAHMKEMTDLRKVLDPYGGRVMGSRAMGGESDDDKQGVEEAEYVATMLGRSIEDDNGFRSWGQETINKRAIIESEYYREEAPRRVWDNYSAPWYDYIHNPPKKNDDAWDLTSEEFVIGSVNAYNHYYSNRVKSNSSRQTYSGAAMLCWTDSMQHGRNYNTENARMSGRTDPIRIKKQSFYASQVMQSEDPAVYLLGHWNYSKNVEDYPKELDPTKKNVYVVASNVKFVELFIDGVSKGRCVSPIDGFLYTFNDIDITQTGGYIEAKGCNAKGETLVSHKIETTGEASRINIKPAVTGPKGLLADGSDVAFFDIEVVDAEGRVIPDNYSRLELSLTGNAILKGGYNSGCYSDVLNNSSTQLFPNQNLNNDPTVVYAECGTNRVFVRATDTPGDITLTVSAPELGISSSTTITSTEVSTENGLTLDKPQSVINADVEPRKDPEAPKQEKMLSLMKAATIIFGNGGNAYRYIEEDNKQYIKVYVDDAEVQGLTAYMMAGSVFGDLESFANAIGATVTIPSIGADLNNAQFEITKDGTIVRIKGSKVVDENGQELATINQIAEWVDGKLYAELSEIVSQLGLRTDKVSSAMTEYHVWTDKIVDKDYSFVLDLTGLTEEKYSANEYIAVNDFVSIKADSQFIANDSVKLTKGNAKIKISPKVNGIIAVSVSGGEAIMPDYENRQGGEMAVQSDVPIAVEAGKEYYLQGSSSSAAKVTKISFTESIE